MNHTTNQAIQRGLERWAAARETLEARVKALQSPEQLTQLELDDLHDQHPFLRDLFLCRIAGQRDDALYTAAAARAAARHGTSSAQLLPDLEAVMEFFWALRDVESAALPDHPRYEIARKTLQEREQALTPQQCVLAQQYVSDVNFIAEHYTHGMTLHKIQHKWEDELRQRLIDECWAPYGEDAKYLAGYALAAAGTPDPLLPRPFAHLGYMGPSWEDGGMTFRIEPRCFADPDPLLYYQDTDVYRPGMGGWDPTSMERFHRLSSGLTAIEPAEDHMILFRLDPGAVKKIFHNRGEILFTETLGGYLFVRTGSRDFHCEFGELRDGEKIPLARFNI